MKRLVSKFKGIMGERSLQKLGGISAILEALVYISAFMVYGGLLVYPDANASAQERLNFLVENQFVLSLLNFTSYVLFGILLVVLVLALHHRFKHQNPILSKIASVFGYVWVVLVIASGMIANIGLSSVIKMGATNPNEAMYIFSSINIVTDGLGGGNEIVGGLWVLLVSIIGLQGKQMAKGISILGLLVGVAGILTVYPLDIFKEIFGLSQIVWFLVIGVVLIRKPSA
ncbi:MAG: DUF4386 family protein [Bacteroidota bacterium]